MHPKNVLQTGRSYIRRQSITFQHVVILSLNIIWGLTYFFPYIGVVIVAPTIINHNNKCDNGLFVLAQVEQKLVVNHSCMPTSEIKYVFGYA